MQIKFHDNSTLDIYRMYKSYDFKTSDTRLTIDFPRSMTEEEIASKDFSSFQLVRSGMENLTFEGYEPEALTIDYSPGDENLGVTLTKSE